MTRVLDTPGQAAAERLLLDAELSIRAAFDALGLGFDYDEATEYLRGAPAKPSFGYLVGVVLVFAIVCVEQERARIGDVIAAVGFLHSEAIPEDLAERLADPSDDDMRRVRDLVALRRVSTQEGSSDG